MSLLHRDIIQTAQSTAFLTQQSYSKSVCCWPNALEWLATLFSVHQTNRHTTGTRQVEGDPQSDISDECSVPTARLHQLSYHETGSEPPSTIPRAHSVARAHPAITCCMTYLRESSLLLSGLSPSIFRRLSQAFPLPRFSRYNAEVTIRQRWCSGCGCSLGEDMFGFPKDFIQADVWRGARHLRKGIEEFGEAGGLHVVWGTRKILMPLLLVVRRLEQRGTEFKKNRRKPFRQRRWL